MSEAEESASLPQRTMLLIAAVQGIVLLYLKNAFESGYWPAESPLFSFPIWTLALAVPVFLLLSIERGNPRKLLGPMSVFMALITLVAIYTGSQARPWDAFPVHEMAVVFGLTAALACFKALMYVQQRAAGAPMTYEVLFTYSWRNFLTLGLALLMTAVFWLILQLWGALFETIGVDFFERLFRMDWFIIPVLSIAHGFGIVIFRNLTHVIDSITRLLEGLIRVLLPLAVAVAVIFVFALPVVGMNALWSTGRGTALLLWLLAVVLFFANAVYQDGRGEKPYPAWLHRVLYAGLCVTPVISALSCYGLVLRVGQYGLTVERCWAFVVWLVLTLFAVGYVAGIVRRRDGWTLELGRVNTGMGLVVLALMLLANSPVLDFRKLAVESQLARLESGDVELREVDFWYLHRALARAGYLALEDLKARAADDPELLARIEEPQPAGRRPTVATEEFWADVHYRPGPFEVPEGLQQLVHDWRFGEDRRPVMIRADLDEDGRDEYILVRLYGGHLMSATLYHSDGDVWQADGMTHWRNTGQGASIPDAVLRGEIALVEPAVKDLALGEVVLRVGDPALFRASPEDGVAEREEPVP